MKTKNLPMTAAMAAGAAAILVANMSGAAVAASASEENRVKIDFATTAISPDLAIHDTEGLLAFIASDTPKKIVINTDSNSVTSVTD